MNKSKIEIKKGSSFVFLGSMNAMPMMYAWELKQRGFNVLYFVDASRDKPLSRPENHFPGVSYPYPDWIVELKLPTQMVLPYFRALYARLIMRRVLAISGQNICFFLNGFFISLAPWLARSGSVISLSHGSDLDVWANKSNANALGESFGKRSIFKFFPSQLSKRLIRKAVNAQYCGFSSSHAVVYFPKGFNEAGDQVINSLRERGVSIFERYDISFEPLRGISRNFKEFSCRLVLFSGVRFMYRTFPNGNLGYSKGNDLIIQGIAKYFRRNPRIEVHFVEKGEDVQHAKELCESLGMSSAVTWHSEMPFNKLTSLYLLSDICFDQVGPHWVGAIGAYALYLGKPLIANVSRAVDLGVFPQANPVMCVRTADEVFEALVKLEDNFFRERLSRTSKAFVEKEMGCQKLLDELLDFSDIKSA